MDGRACQTGMGFVIVIVLVALGAWPLAAGAAPQPQTVGVVDFYAPTPLAVIGGVVPEIAAADELSGLLSRAAGPDVTVISRATMERAEAAMGWREPDALRFGRLAQLAQAVDASRLVVGWIPSFSSGGGSGDIPAPDGNGMPIAQAAVVIQVFDAAQGRIVAETRSGATTIGALPSILIEQVLREAVEPTVPWLLRTITAPS
jgi:hypothetical protein